MATLANSPFADQRPAMVDETDLNRVKVLCNVRTILEALIGMGDSVCTAQQLIVSCRELGVNPNKLHFLLKVLVTRYRFPVRGDVHPVTDDRRPGVWLTQRWMYALCFPWVWALSVQFERVASRLSSQPGDLPDVSASDLADDMQVEQLAPWYLVALSRDHGAVLTLPKIPDVAYFLTRVLILAHQAEIETLHLRIGSQARQGETPPVGKVSLAQWRGHLCMFGFHAAFSLLRGPDPKGTLLFEHIRESPLIADQLELTIRH